jgi:3-hydroxybutyrate dehydrogenase
MDKLKNKVCIITGSARGIGRGIAEKFAQEGAKVVITDLNLADVENAANEIGGDTFGLVMDVTKEADVDQGVAKAVETYGSVDVLVNNAGIQVISPFEEFATDDWKKVIDIHLHGSFFASRACMLEMKKSGRGGSIIFMGSVHSVLASLKKSAYVVAKHALSGMTRSIAKEGAEYNIRANLVSPGFVKTPLVEKQIPEQAKTLDISEEEVVKKVMLGNTVDGEFTTIEEVAEVALFFASFPTNALTGQSLLVSHGWHMQ